MGEADIRTFPIAAFGLAYLFFEPFRAEANRAAGVLAGGDIEAAREYILSYGAWAPFVSAALMVLQALAAPLPAFLITFANGLAFGAFWGGMLSLASADRWFERRRGAMRPNTAQTYLGDT